MILIASITTSCSTDVPSTLDRFQYADWLQANKQLLTETKEIDGVTYQARYQPPEYRIIRYLDGAEDTSEFKTIQAEVRSNYKFIIRIYGKEGKHPFVTDNEMDYFKRLEYFNTAAQYDFSLICNQSDTVECSFLHLERNFQTAPYLSMIISFRPGIEKIETLKLVYQDRIYNNGLINFIFDEEINHLPKLDI